MIKHLLNVAMVLTVLAVVTQTASARITPLAPVPEVASTSLLLGVAFGGMAFMRRFFR